MIIGTCGFSWSGSSAVADYLAEFKENQVYNEIEFILAFYPDGLEDLDYNLNYKCAKFLSSTVAIPRFKRVAHDILYHATKGQIDGLTEKYLDSLVQVEWIGKGQGQNLLHNRWIYNNLGEKLARPLLNRIPENIARGMKVYPLGEMQYSIKPEGFIRKTQEYTDNILRSIGLDLRKNIVLDQPFAGNNPANTMKYYRDSRCIIVDRDPRDLYLLAKRFFNKRSYAVPHQTVDQFITYFYHMHKDMETVKKKKNILYVRFEDLIYEYDSTTEKIRNFLKLGFSDAKKKYFIPERSMANTRLYLRCPELAEDIKKIEIQLHEWIFDFTRYNEIKPVGDIFDENPPIDWKKEI